MVCFVRVSSWQIQILEDFEMAEMAEEKKSAEKENNKRVVE